MTPKKTVIIGGGLAGIAAAVRLLEAGQQPLLIEATPGLGGRVRSAYARDAGRWIDNGQHVLAASYRETRWLLDKLGTRDRVFFQPRLEISYRLSRRRRFDLKAWRLPAPFHLLLPLLFKTPLTARDRRTLLRWGFHYFRASEEQLRPKSVREWLDEAGSGPLLEKILWEPITLATLNTPLEKASALLLYQVLKQAFLESATNSGLGIPLAPLSEIFGDPARQYLETRGAKIRFGNPVKELHFHDGRVEALQLSDGSRCQVAALISALPPAALNRLMGHSRNTPPALQNTGSRFQYSPIITISFWLRQALDCPAPLAFVNSPVQWIFKLPERSGDGFGYSAVISAAHREVLLPKEDLLELLKREFQGFHGQDLARDYGLMAWKVVKEKKATFLQTPESLRWRPACKTVSPNFFLAGDWTDTGLPATIESAVLSGKSAAQTLLEATG